MEQGELFNDPPPTAAALVAGIKGIAGALASARAERDAALGRAEANAPETWGERAAAWLREYLGRHAEYFPDTDNRACPEQPPQLRAWGFVVLYALRERWIEPTDEFRPRTRGHCTPGRVYRSLLYRGN